MITNKQMGFAPGVPTTDPRALTRASRSVPPRSLQRSSGFRPTALNDGARVGARFAASRMCSGVSKSARRARLHDPSPDRPSSALARASTSNPILSRAAPSVRRRSSHSPLVGGGSTLTTWTSSHPAGRFTRGWSSGAPCDRPRTSCGRRVRDRARPRRTPIRALSRRGRRAARPFADRAGFDYPRQPVVVSRGRGPRVAAWMRARLPTESGGSGRRAARSHGALPWGERVPAAAAALPPSARRRRTLRNTHHLRSSARCALLYADGFGHAVAPAVNPRGSHTARDASAAAVHGVTPIRERGRASPSLPRTWYSTTAAAGARLRACTRDPL